MVNINNICFVCIKNLKKFFFKKLLIKNDFKYFQNISYVIYNFHYESKMNHNDSKII